jgi:hypothetical protein
MTKTTLTKIAGALLGAESALLPVFIHNPQSGAIAGVVLMAEEAVFSAFGILPSAPASAAPAPAASPASGTKLT